MRRRIAGLALDGRRDVAALGPDGEGGGTGDEEVRLIDGGTCADVITTEAGRRIAGPQAALAPHGRGPGWGPIGDPARRRPLAAAIDACGRDEAHAADLAAAIAALARGAEEVVLAVPDLPRFDEAAQGAVLRAARGSGARRVRLLWRPVAAMLALIEAGDLGPEDLGARLRILIHGPKGIEEQTLTLREDPEHTGHLAPQRDGPGRLLPSGPGLDELFRRAAGSVPAGDRSGPVRLGPELLVGAARPGDMELLRDRFGRWHVVTAPELDPEALLAGAQPLPAPEAPCAASVLVTPLAPRFAEELAARIGGVARILGPEAVARGCLRAGRLIERGLPHYFDRLEAISIAVQRRPGEPAFAPLIPEGHVVAANREYVSEDLTGFVWPCNKDHAEFYVLKGRSELREWTVNKPAAPPADVPVILRIRQTPGQSWAVLEITSQIWDALARAPERLDWEELRPIDLTPEALLERLRTPPPTIPERIVEPAHRDLWLGTSGRRGGEKALQLAQQAARGGMVDARRWAVFLCRPARHPQDGGRCWPVSTDGALPEGLPPEAYEGFARMLEVLAGRLLAGPWPPDNEPLKALTWCFAACPEPVQDAILEALEAEAAGRPHRLTALGRAIPVLRQGAGRVLTGQARLRRLFALIARQPLNNHMIGALATALTRRAEAPQALDRELVDRFLDRLGEELLEQVWSRSFKAKFKNTLAAIAGLFRWREREPYALLASGEARAAALQDRLEKARGMLARPEWQSVPARAQKVELLAKILDYLKGRGDPAILRLIESSEEEGEEG